MNKNYNHIIFLIIYLLFCVFKTNCYSGFGAFEQKNNDEIDIVLRQQIENLNSKIIKSINDDNPQVIINLFVDEIKNDPEIKQKTKN